ncbi:MAG: hypothetical protein WCV00_11980 [Verrucomicrobiia bacterium]
MITYDGQQRKGDNPDESQCLLHTKSIGSAGAFDKPTACIEVLNGKQTVEQAAKQAN